jgi:hypothetical protein
MQVKKIEFSKLIGLHKLSAVESAYKRIKSEIRESFIEVNTFSFTLDNNTYTAYEDDSDEYRSAMEKLTVSKRKIKNSFAPVDVFVGYSYDKFSGPDKELLQFYAVKNGLVILEVGTDNSDSYYPRFVGSWRPDRLKEA